MFDLKYSSAWLCSRFAAGRLRCGFTIIEILIVVVILAIAAMTAIPMMSSAGSVQVRSVANMIAADLEYAKSLAITKGQNDPALPTFAPGYISHQPHPHRRRMFASNRSPNAPCTPSAFLRRSHIHVCKGRDNSTRNRHTNSMQYSAVRRHCRQPLLSPFLQTTPEAAPPVSAEPPTNIFPQGTIAETTASGELPLLT